MVDLYHTSGGSGVGVCERVMKSCARSVQETDNLRCCDHWSVICEEGLAVPKLLPIHAVHIDFEVRHEGMKNLGHVLSPDRGPISDPL